MGTNRDPFDSAPRAFISYARSDGEEFAASLRQRLNREEPEITLWQDRDRLEGGIGWWKQITDAIEQVEFLIMVLTPNVMTSEVAQREWRYARQQGVRVCPVMRAVDPNLNFAALPNWMRKAHCYDLEKEWGTFIGFLKSAGKGDRVPFMAPDMREDFVQRPEEFESLISSLLDPTRSDPVAITTSIRGSGGFGKTTLATALCHQADVVNAFDDGILWATLGEHPNAQREITKVYAALTGDRPAFLDAEDAAIQLAARLENKHCLLVIDDVWSPDEVKPLLRGGKSCARLITTRLQPVVTELGAHGIVVNQMTSEQSVELLTAKLAPMPADLMPFEKLAKRLGDWPLLCAREGRCVCSRGIAVTFSTS
jgi:hypothetical protein